jgi:hypothetical protein
MCVFSGFLIHILGKSAGFRGIHSSKGLLLYPDYALKLVRTYEIPHFFLIWQLLIPIL